MYELIITTYFEAAHCLPDYPGKCARLHGHNWTVETCISSEQLDQLGMVMDFKELKRHVHEVTEGLDHRYLNEIEPWQTTPPTAEHLSRYIYREVKKLMPNHIHIEYVKIWESQGSAALYREGK